MKKALLIVCLLAVLALGAKGPEGKLFRLTIVNKSEMDMAYHLLNIDGESFYYLKVPAGSREAPTEKVFTIEPGVYMLRPYYIETWDPVYGVKCGGAGSKLLIVARNIRITFLKCGVRARFPGEPSMFKFSPQVRYIY